jgi:hypothetical protein
MLIVREAGGLVEAVEPGEDPLLAGTILAANEPIFDTSRGSSGTSERAAVRARSGAGRWR